MEFLDEFYAGAVGLGAAEIQHSFQASYTAVSAALLFGPALVALFVEPFLFVLADRYPRKWFLAGGTAAMGVGGLLAAGSSSLAGVGAAISLAYLGSGAGVAMAQATLVDRFPESRERLLARWTLLGEIGDLFAPALMALVAALQGGWRSALVVVSLAMLLWAVTWLALESRRPTDIPEQQDECSDDDEDEEPGIFEALKIALRNKALLGWLAATATCDLMDNLLTVFAVLYLEKIHGADSLVVSVVIGAGVAGSIIGLIACERVFLARFTSRSVLWVTSAACAACYLWWLQAESFGALGFGFFAVGFTAAPMYPITIARAYAALPGHSGTVNAVAHLFTPFSLLLPLGMGLLADHWGLSVALSFVVLQPLILLVVGLKSPR